MANITAAQVNAWFAGTKLSLSSLDDELEQQVSAQVLARLSVRYNTADWVNESTTPTLVRSIIAMLYGAWHYDRVYGDDNDETNTYSALLRQQAEVLIMNIVGGIIDLPEVPVEGELSLGQPAFFPNDLSSAEPSSVDFPENGPPAFIMGRIW